MKYILGVIGVIFVTIFAIILIVTRTPKSPDTSVKVGKKVLVASDYAKDDSTVSFTIAGRLVGDESRRTIRVSVTKNLRTVEELSGYDQKVVRTQSYINTQSGYEEFLKALDIYGFNRERTTTFKSEKGVCPLGRTFILALNKGSDEPLRTWANSCNSKQGTAAGPISTIQTLFQNQIPDYNKFTSTINL